ncbi:MAG TPA: hypothetical protein EYH07_14890 [Kiloniellaceae bacterium]|nr:hypothetical protein [Kiloniellaceae bacterium]HIP79736.1 hypothetical protein [Kiloniellaceae bacterium]
MTISTRLRRVYALFFLAFLCALPLPAGAQEAGAQDAGQADLLPAPRASYTAETLVTYAGDSLEMKTLHRGSWERQEFTVDELIQVTILRPDRNRAYMMFLQSGQLFEMPYAEAALLPPIGELRTFEVRKLAEEEIEGETVGHFQAIRRPTGEGAEEREPVVLDLWVTADGIVMKAEGEILVDGFRETLQIERRNIRRQTLDPDLFEPSITLPQ